MKAKRSLAIHKGKEFALNALNERREQNDRKNLTSLPIGLSMSYRCTSCGANVYPSGELCDECKILQDCSYL